MTALTAPAPAPASASPGTALTRLLLGPELTPTERALIRAVLDHAARPPAIHLPAIHLPRWAGRGLLRRLGIVTATITSLFGLTVITAPPAQAFSIFGPVKKAVSEAITAFLDALAASMCTFVGDMVHGILGYADRGLAVDFSVGWFKHNSGCRMNLAD